MRQLVADLDASNYETAVEIASLPEAIRGFGTVKDLSIERVKAEEVDLLAEFQRATGSFETSS